MFLCACIEGEIAVLTAGFLCRRGLLSLDFVILSAFLGTLLAEQGLFFVGRIYGVRLIEKYPKFFRKSKKIMEFLRQYNAAFIIGSRFIYGIRNISPIIIGMAQIPPVKFAALNIFAALTWAISVAGVGYLFADALNIVKEHMKILQAIALISFALAVIVFVRKKSKKRAVNKKT